MKTAIDVFEFSPSTEDYRPQLDFEIPQNGAAFDWLRAMAIVEDERPLEDYVAPRLVVPRPDALDWHFYSDVGCSSGLVSEMAANLLRPYFDRYFMLLPASINNAPYFMLKPIDRLDCLDRKQSTLRCYPHDLNRIMRITKYFFHMDRVSDPLIFTIPEFSKRTLCTQSIPQIIHDSGLKGFSFIHTRDLRI